MSRDQASYINGIRAAVTWLHKRAEEMNDPHARAVLNSAAFSLGQSKPEFAAEDGSQAPVASDGEATDGEAVGRPNPNPAETEARAARRGMWKP